MKWLLVAVIVTCTIVSDLLQSREMKRHGEIRDFRPSRFGGVLLRLARRRYLLLAIFFMAVSFTAFLALLAVADLSFAVPATAASYAVETLLARYVLKETLSWKRWAGAGLVTCGVALLAM